MTEFALALSVVLFAPTAVPVEKIDTQPQQLARTFVQRMAAGQFEKAVEAFDPAMKAALAPDKLKKTWNSVVGQFGALRRADETRVERKHPYQLMFVTCRFEKGQIDAQVTIAADHHISGLFFVSAYRPPAYVDRSRFEEFEVTVGRGMWSLPGTLSMPKGSGPFRAVVLVHGTGPNDRDETIGPNKPFRDLAQGLATRGVAVLRYEKRTREHGVAVALLLGHLTVKEESVDDAAAAVELLAAHSKIDHGRIFVLGHSLGGCLLPRIAEANRRIAGLVSLAGNTRPFEDVALEQTRYLATLPRSPNQSDANEKQLKLFAREVARLKRTDLSKPLDDKDPPLGVPWSYWRDLRGYDPAARARPLKNPMLILQGERDYQVTMEDFAGWKRALDSRADVSFRSYPELNHLFMKGTGKSTPAEYEFPGNVAETVIRDIAEWIGRQKAVS